MDFPEALQERRVLFLFSSRSKLILSYILIYVIVVNTDEVKV